MTRRRWAVCPRCRGEGQHTNPAIDGQGLTGEDIDRLGGDEFLEDYLSGHYDIRCEMCSGHRVIPACVECEQPAEATSTGGPFLEHCWNHLTTEEYAEYEDRRESQAEMEAERRMGA